MDEPTTDVLMAQLIVKQGQQLHKQRAEIIRLKADLAMAQTVIAAARAVHDGVRVETRQIAMSALGQALEAIDAHQVASQEARRGTKEG